ncbi:MAG: glutamate mutase L [Candidatus Cloacimonadales bacterium]|jgi:uncharacterized protein (TIGR01319 family)|nr:glutamate mutase L [Candidatus Cloacimonadales bacterium]
MKLKPYILIIDIGSTTTKSLLLKRGINKYNLIGIEISPTTVEKPFEDVKVGIRNSIKNLEAKHNKSILSETNDDLLLQDDISFLATSSAGGGLQILVVGLTLLDSAASAQRAAYGVGGVILNTLAIDDNRSSVERILILNTIHPDIILFCGGVSGGALFSVIRMADLLRNASIEQKFIHDEKIPLVFAGNENALDFVNTVFPDRYDLHIVENIRPKLKEENLEPAKNKMQELFLNSVMEHAPGYAPVKKMVEVDIIPTPTGVLNTMKLLGKKHRNVISFDMGGATTDVFSYIVGNHQRSVSANYGMSYSIGNIIANSDFENDFKPYLKSINFAKDDYFYNYIGNKILFPTSNPTNDIETFIEHITAIQGIKLSIAQHFQLYFGIRDGLYESILKLITKQDKYHHLFEAYKSFYLSDINIFIGSGGVISHASKKQALFMMIESFNPLGIAELWRDKHFISPHIGVLSTLDEGIAETLLYDECYEKLAVYIKAKPVCCMPIRFSINGKKYSVRANDFFYTMIDKDEKVTIRNVELFKGKVELNLTKGVPLIIDTRNPNNIFRSANIILNKLKPYNDLDGNDIVLSESSFCDKFDSIKTENNLNLLQKHQYLLEEIKFSLPYKGDIFVKANQIVNPDTLLGENKFPPPKVHILSIFRMLDDVFTETEIRENILIKEGDFVSINQNIFNNPHYDDNNGAAFSEPTKAFEPIVNTYMLKQVETLYSPVKGIVETIYYNTGIIILKEIQDYPLTPVEIDIMDMINAKYQDSKTFKIRKLKKIIFRKEGDMVYEGAPMFPYHSHKFLIHYPYTGTIQKIDAKKGTISICYDKKPHRLYSQTYGKIKKIIDDKDFIIEAQTINIAGKIGFGKDIGGFFTNHSNGDLKDKIVYKSSLYHYDDIDELVQAKIKGLVCETIDYQLLKRFLGKDIGVAITGDEDIPFSIVILQGFINRKIEDHNHDFSPFIDKYVLLKPQTQIRAGVIRPSMRIFDNADNHLINP